jgi:hypothetical protein
MKYGAINLQIYPKVKGVLFKLETYDGSDIPNEIVRVLREFCIPLKARDIVVAYTTSHTEDQVMEKLNPILKKIALAS